MRDSYDLLVKESGDGGDCAFDTGLFYSSCLYLYGLDNVIYSSALITLMKLHTNDNKYFRHPDPNKWYSRPECFSRDQSVSLQCLLTVMKDAGTHKAMIKARGSYLLHTNTEEEDRSRKFPDVISPFEISLWIRSFKLWYLYWLLPILDLDLLVELLVIRPRKLWDTDAALINKLVAVEMSRQSFISRLTKRLYKNKNVDECLQAYYNSDNPGHRLPEAYEIALLAYNKLMRTV